MDDQNRFWAGSVCFVLGLALAGCGREEIRPPGDAALARETLIQTLDSWKVGMTTEDLRSQEPAIYARDFDWEAGRRLSRYELIDEAVQNGGEWRIFAMITVMGERGASPATKVCYSVTPGTPASVARSDTLY